ncbi:MAG: class I mannose-6-phosphate isomerase [Defluviitaleaceae bacterium]|nr:class I mannose-6-phosphate isomerase [Defluviitaleaceae bacterium]
MHHYPLLLTPIYKQMLWGGNRLNAIYNRNSPHNNTGESWDISCRPGEMGVIENGLAAGQTLAEYIAADKTGTLGTRLVSLDSFPLLVKLIDANDYLSVQVHPGDDLDEVALHSATSTSQWQASDTGKSEMWYILTPPTDGHLIMGLKPGITPAILRTAIESGTVESCLHRLPVAAGDIVNIPAGLIHALTPGVMVAEVQQNSDITYRIYDYNRVGIDGKPRELHIEESLAVADFENKIPKTTIPGLVIKKGDCTFTYAIANKHFAIIKYNLHSSFTETSDPAAFSIFTCVEGEVTITPHAMPGVAAAAVQLATGRSVFIPAGLGSYTIHPKGEHATILKSYVPDVKKDFVAPLLAYGYTRDEIAAYTATAL